MANSSRIARHVRRSRYVGLLSLFLLLVALPLGALAQPYTLQPGDQIRLSILDLPVPSVTVRVGIDGRVTFPYFGSFDARGVTPEQLQEQIGLAATGMVVSVYSDAGERLQVALDGTGIFLAIESYRPVYMIGDVAIRGPIEYLPGMTVRTVLASAGGASEVPVMFEQALMQAPELRSDYHSLATEHASTVVRLWGIDAILAGDPDRSPPDASEVVVTPERVADFVAAERRNVEFQLEEIAHRRSYLTQQIEALTGQIDRFDERLRNQQTVLELETEQVTQIEELADRGLAATSRLNDARQGLLSISSSLLDAESAMADLSLRREELQQELEMLTFNLEGEYRAQRADLMPQILTLSSQLQAARQTMMMNGVIVQDDGPQEPSMTFELARANEDGTTTVNEAALDTALLPGDVVDVRLEYPFIRALNGAGAEGGDDAGSPTTQPRFLPSSSLKVP